MMDAAIYVLAGLLMIAGLAGAILPALPGIPLLFAGIWLAAGVDHYQHAGTGWLIAIGVAGLLGMAMDFIAGTLGAKRAGASSRALWGAAIGTVIGLFFGLAGLLLGPFLGALAGELSAGNSVLRSTHVGVSAWFGMLLGTLVKLVLSFVMLGMFGFAWLLA